VREVRRKGGEIVELFDSEDDEEGGTISSPDRSQVEAERKAGKGKGEEKKGRHRRKSSRDSKGDILASPSNASLPPVGHCHFTNTFIYPTSRHYSAIDLKGKVYYLSVKAVVGGQGGNLISNVEIEALSKNYPTSFSVLPPILLDSSSWLRISKYCSFTKFPIPDGVKFYYSKTIKRGRGGSWFLLPEAFGGGKGKLKGLVLADLALLIKKYPQTAAKTPELLLADGQQWGYIEKFCFFSNGPINEEVDVYFSLELTTNDQIMTLNLGSKGRGVTIGEDGKPQIFMLSVFKLEESFEIFFKNDFLNSPLRTTAQVEQLEEVYQLTDEDFQGIKVCHTAQYERVPAQLMTPHKWTKVLPPVYARERRRAMSRAAANELGDKLDAKTAQEDKELEASRTTKRTTNPQPPKPNLTFSTLHSVVSPPPSQLFKTQRKPSVIEDEENNQLRAEIDFTADEDPPPPEAKIPEPELEPEPEPEPEPAPELITQIEALKEENAKLAADAKLATEAKKARVEIEKLKEENAKLLARAQIENTKLSAMAQIETTKLSAKAQAKSEIEKAQLLAQAQIESNTLSAKAQRNSEIEALKAENEKALIRSQVETLRLENEKKLATLEIERLKEEAKHSSPQSQLRSEIEIEKLKAQAHMKEEIEVLKAENEKALVRSQIETLRLENEKNLAKMEIKRLKEENEIMARSYSLKTETEMALAKAAQTETETKEKIARIEIDKLKE